jgi:diguanylate cyclase (GGDEF)-like protein
MMPGEDTLQTHAASLPTAPLRTLPPSLSAHADETVVSRSIVRHFNASLPERRRLLLEMWDALRANPGDRALRARLSRHLKVLIDAAGRAGAGPVDAAARVADRTLPHVSEDGHAVLESALDSLLDAMAALSQREAPAIAGRMPMVVLDGIERPEIDWLPEVLVASGCQVEQWHGEPAVPPLALAYLVLVDSAADPARIARWCALARAGDLAMRVAVVGDDSGFAARRSWSDVDAVISPRIEPQALLSAVERELGALEDPRPCVALLGILEREVAWVEALFQRGFFVVCAGGPDDVWKLTRDEGLDAVVTGPGLRGEEVDALALALAQDETTAATRILRIATAGDDDARLFAAGVEAVPAALEPSSVACALLGRRRRRPRVTQGEGDPLTGALRRAPFMLLMQGMLDGPAAFVGLGVIDLDGLREINAAQGHEAGDRLLRGVARRLRGALPATAALGRGGSDEFLFGFTARNEAEARRMMAQVANLPPDGNGAPRIGHCIGGVLLDRDDRAQRVPLTELVARAGELMLDAKASSGSRIALARYGERPIGERWF